MKKYLIISFLFGMIGIITISCEHASESECYKGQILAITCGGTVIQFLDTSKNGEEWVNHFTNESTTYSSCVLVGNLSSINYKKGDTIYFNYENVEIFTSGNFCDIGGLPKGKIEISQYFNENCSINS